MKVKKIINRWEYVTVGLAQLLVLLTIQECENIPWNWDTTYQHISLSGKNRITCFKNIYKYTDGNNWGQQFVETGTYHLV